MRVSIAQPAYLPWLGYIDRIQKSDIHIILDDVMLERSSKTRFTNRNKIKTANGELWLTVPVQKSGEGQPLICEARISEGKWLRKHVASIRDSYKRSEYFSEHEEWLEAMLQKNFSYLHEVLSYTTDYIINKLGVDTKIIRSSSLGVTGVKSEYILNLCRDSEATSYLSGPFGRDYLELDDFENSGIQVEFHDYDHPVYKQLYGDFLPYMSVLDLMFNEGPKSMEILSV